MVWSADERHKNMEKSRKFYSRIPGFKVVYEGSNDDTFTTFKIGEDCYVSQFGA